MTSVSETPKKIRCVSARRRQAEVGRVGRPPALPNEQDAEIVDRLMHDASEGKFLTKGELFNKGKEPDRTILMDGWANWFVYH
jgi:hypothetical protein